MTASILRWLNGTKFGSALVPEVWRMKAGAPGSGSPGGNAAPISGTANCNLPSCEIFASMIGKPRCSAAVRAAESVPRRTSTAWGRRVSRHLSTSASVSLGSIGTAVAEHAVAITALAACALCATATAILASRSKPARRRQVLVSSISSWSIRYEMVEKSEPTIAACLGLSSAWALIISPMVRPWCSEMSPSTRIDFDGPCRTSAATLGDPVSSLLIRTAPLTITQLTLKKTRPTPVVPAIARTP
jgi:hypothetical protein